MGTMLSGKHILLGVTGSIAAYKIASLASMLVKADADVTVLMTKNAQNFINPITFETLTGHKCLIDTFDRNFSFDVEHVSVAKTADVFLLAPATANCIGKIASGIADDMLTTTFLTCRCSKIIAPAMNTQMFANPILQDNLRKLSSFGMQILHPASGRLACGDVGEGKMPEPEVLFCAIERAVSFPHDLEGKKVLVTAGPTQEAIDPVRFITNHSTGKMGYAVAKNAMLRGADVTLITGPTSLAPPQFTEVVPVISAEEMASAVKERAEDTDIFVLTAAVADYRMAHPAEEKIKKSDEHLSIDLERTEDILLYIGNHKKDGQFLCGFSMETEQMLLHSQEKRQKKHADLMVANSLRTAGAGFGTDTNVVTFIKKDGCRKLPLMSKDDVAAAIFDEILSSL